MRPHRLAALVGLSLLLALLGSPTLTATAQPTPSKSIVVALGHEPDRFYNPASMAGQLVANLVYDPLVGLDDQMHPYPALAAEIPSLDNNLAHIVGSGADRRLVVTMPLRQGVTWSDGEPFTADDVVYMWQLMENPRSGFDTSLEDKLKSVEKLDDLTVRFTYLSATEARVLDPDRYAGQPDNEPVVDPLYGFGLADAPAIYPRHKLREIVGDDPRHSRAVTDIETSELAFNPVGTGPYTLAGWEPGTALTFVSRGAPLPHRGAPAIDTVVFRSLPDRNDAVAALAAGDVQVIAQDGLDATAAPVLDSLPGVQARYVPGRAWEQLTFNLDNPILAEPAVRQAIAHGLNRTALNDDALFGKGQVAVSQVPSWSWAFNPDVPTYDYDPDLAEQLLDRAGWTRPAPDAIREKHGQRLSFTYSSAPAAFRSALMSMVKDQLERIGIELNVEVVPSATLFDTTPGSPQALIARQFAIAEFAWVSGYDPGPDAVYTLHSSSVPSRANSYRGGNYADYRNARSDQLLDQVQRSLDPGFRHAALAEAQAIWQTNLPVLPLLLRPVTTAASAQLSNFRPTPAPAGETWNVEDWDLGVGI